MASERLRLISWNVNGLRAAARQGFRAWLARSGAGLVCLQEVRALPEDLPDTLRQPRGWWVHFSPARRLGYSGVALYTRCAPDAVETALGQDCFDAEGRLQIVRFGRLVVANVYFPKGSGRDRDNRRVAYKLEFYRALFARLARLRRRGDRVLVAGDFNTAHREIDLARPRENTKTSGFLPEERAELDRWVAAGWRDTFREFESGPGHYTWWRQWGGARERNVGWRIDYVFASPSALPFVERAFILPGRRGSDHAPVGVDLDPAVVGRGRRRSRQGPE